MPPEGKLEASGSPLISSLPENSATALPSPVGDRNESCFSAVIPVSGFRLHPIVAAGGEHPSMTAADGEVARILEVPIDALTDHRALRVGERTRDGRPYRVPAFHVHGFEIWGATAMVLAEFLALLGWHRERE